MKIVKHQNILLEIKKKKRVEIRYLVKFLREHTSSVLSELMHNGYVKISGNFLMLTKAGEKALSFRKPKGPSVVLAYRESSPIMIYKPSFRTSKKLREAGYLVGEGYFVKGNFPETPRDYKKLILNIEKSIKEGKIRYAALGIYRLSKILKDKEVTLLAESRENVKNPTLERSLRLLNKIKKKL